MVPLSKTTALGENTCFAQDEHRTLDIVSGKAYDGHRTLDIVRLTFYGGHPALDIVCLTSYVGHGSLDIVRWTWYVGHRFVHWTSYGVWCTSHGGHCALDIVRWASYGGHPTVDIVWWPNVPNNLAPNELRTFRSFRTFRTRSLFRAKTDSPYPCLRRVWAQSLCPGFLQACID